MKMNQKNEKQRRWFWRGETLVEVIIAVFVVSLGSAIAASLIVTSFQANTLSRDNLIAMNLAGEGIEAVRGVRDTNWLKYGFDKDNCWNVLPSESGCSLTSNKITAGYYTVELDQNLVWQMTKVNPQIALNLGSSSALNNDLYKLKILSRNEVPFFSHYLLDYPASVNYEELEENPQYGRFYRMIEILNIIPDAGGTPVSMEVKSSVQWKTQGRVNTASLNLILTNYQKVKK